jgi:nitroimidazol reductase NimA-like FMN-containing flavoprotein (pyridoxamine 5'-phosphate oxidase superfamily)
MNSSQKAKYLIKNSENMVIATADQNGKPWISPVSFQPDSEYSLYWVSSKEALHSQNIRNRPEVAIVIVGKTPDGAVDGVYFDAMATELEDEADVKHAVAIFAKRPKEPRFDVNSISQVTGDAVWRLYKAKPIQISKRADTTVNNQAITIREKVEL